ncbi:hypothetical protein [Xanthomonas phage JGB6]|nr:hypothetical protein [Xanthomonas phage JGB6]
MSKTYTLNLNAKELAAAVTAKILLGVKLAEAATTSPEDVAGVAGAYNGLSEKLMAAVVSGGEEKTQTLRLSSRRPSI